MPSRYQQSITTATGPNAPKPLPDDKNADKKLFALVVAFPLVSFLGAALGKAITSKR